MKNFFIGAFNVATVSYHNRIVSYDMVSYAKIFLEAV